jgi:hypothetical protein
MSVTPGRMTPEDQRIARVTLAYLHRCLRAESAFFAEARDRPRVGSAMETLIADKDLMQPILLAGMYLEVARDHYGAVLWAFTPPAEVSRYAPYTLLRGALEADAWACWLLDTHITPTERLARSLTVRASDLREVRRLDLADQHSDWDYRERIAQVEAVAARHQLPELRNKEGDLYAVGMRRPEMVPLLEELLPEQHVGPNAQPLGSRTYGLLSARAHGNPWAVLHNVKRAGRVRPHVAVAEVELDVVELMRLLRVALRLHSEAMCRTAILNGQDPEDWEKLRGPTAESQLGE